MIFSVKFSKNYLLRDLWWLVTETQMHQPAINMFLLSLRQDHFSNKTIKFVGPTSAFLYLKKYIFSVKFSKNNPLRDLWRLVSETRMHWLPENMFVLSLKQNHFSNGTIKILGPTPQFFYLNKVIFSVKLRKNDLLRDLWWFVTETGMHRLSKNMFLLSLRQDHFIN